MKRTDKYYDLPEQVQNLGGERFYELQVHAFRPLGHQSLPDQIWISTNGTSRVNLTSFEQLGS